MSHGEKWLVLGLIFPVDSFVLVVEYYRAWKRMEMVSHVNNFNSLQDNEPAGAANLD
ncbi:hypothetical protein [Acetobacter malorum]|uniref:hypothetical protein n=1 Tax=Acetobacter malorum TaxID=178901 RepID=UPI0039E775E0